MENKTKRCPHCGHEVNALARKCMYCKSWIDTDSEAEAHDYTQVKRSVDNEIHPKAKIPFKEAFTETFTIINRNIGWLFLTVLLYMVTSWVPYINIGTTIAIVNLPGALARKERIKPTHIFDAKYRKYMGEYISLWGNMILVFFASIPFGGIPLLVLSMSWSFAPLLLVDKEINSSEAMMQSSKYTYGHKFQMWLLEKAANCSFVVGVIFVCLFFALILQEHCLYAIVPIIVVAIPSFVVLNEAQVAVYYRKLVLNI